MIKAILVGLIAAGAGVLVYAYVASPFMWAGITGLLQPISGLWNGIPSAVRTWIPTMTVGAFATFFAWAKMKWQQKATDIQQQATQKITQVEGKNQELQEQLSTSATAGLDGLMKERDDAVTSAVEAQKLLSQKNTEIQQLQTRHNTELATYKNLLEEYKPKVVTQVK